MNLTKKFKNVLIITMLLSLFISTNQVILAEDLQNNEPEVIIDNTAGNIPENVIQDIISDNLDADVIYIHGYGTIEDQYSSNDASNDTSQNNGISIGTLSTSYGPVTTTTKVNYTKVHAKDEFKFSVARGEETTLTTNYEGTLTGSVSGIPLAPASIGFSITIKGQFSKGTKYSGPSESSSFNSRSFYLRFYQEEGQYTQTRTVTVKNILGIKVDEYTETVSGYYNKPTEWASYSVDRNIQ